MPQTLERSGKDTFYNFGGHDRAAWGPLLQLYDQAGSTGAGNRPGHVSSARRRLKSG